QSAQHAHVPFVSHAHPFLGSVRALLPLWVHETLVPLLTTSSFFLSSSRRVGLATSRWSQTRLAELRGCWGSLAYAPAQPTDGQAQGRTPRPVAQGPAAGGATAARLIPLGVAPHHHGLGKGRGWSGSRPWRGCRFAGHGSDAVTGARRSARSWDIALRSGRRR